MKSAVLAAAVLSLLATQATLAKAAGGFANLTALSVYNELWIAGHGLVSHNAYRPGLACNPVGDCLTIFSELTYGGLSNSPKNSTSQLFYSMWSASEGRWSQKTEALLSSRSDEENSVMKRGQSQPQVVALGDRGWAVVYRNYAYLNSRAGECCSMRETIYVAYISQEAAKAGELWMGEARGYGVHASLKGKAKRFPVIAADTNGTVVVVWETTNDELAENVFIGTDKDLLTSSFSLRDGKDPYGRLERPTSESAFTQVTGVYTGISSDTLQDRNPVMLSDARTGRIVVAATATISGGYAEIFVTESQNGTSRACSWADRVRVTQFDGKDSDVTIAVSPFRDVYLAVWQHRNMGFRWARLEPNDDNLLQVQEMGFVDPTAMGYFTSDVKASLVADPLRDGYWSLFYRRRTPENKFFRLVYRVSRDDGRTWGAAYFADSLEDHTLVEDEDLFRIAVTASPAGDYHAATVWRNKTDINSGSFRVATTAHEVIFGEPDEADRMDPSYRLLYGVDVGCTDVILPLDGSRENLTAYVRDMAPNQVQCIHLVGPNISEVSIHMDVNVLVDLEFFEEYRAPDLCPFDFVTVRTTLDLDDDNFVGPARRICEAGQLDTLVASNNSAYFIVKNDGRGPADGEPSFPATLEAWISPPAPSWEIAEGPASFQVRFADSYEAIQSALLDEEFTRGELVVTAATIAFPFEVRIRKGTNITLTGKPSTGTHVLMRGLEFIHVEIGATLWTMTGFEFVEEREVFQGTSRYGGILLVSGTAGRIENCIFRDTTATGALALRRGAGLAVEGLVYEVVDCVFSKLVAADGAAIAIVSRASIGLIDRCIFSKNQQSGTRTGAGAISISGILHTIRDTSFLENKSNGGGGAVSVKWGGDVRQILNCTFFKNKGDTGGGAVDFKPRSRLPSLWSGGTIYQNSVDVEGGAIQIVEALPSRESSDSSFSIEDVDFEDNEAVAGGAILFDASPLVTSLRVTRCRFASNRATQDSGGAILLRGAVALDLVGSSLLGNSAAVSGGALAVTSGAQAAIADTDFAENLAREQGGAVYAGTGSVLTAHGTSFRDNSARLTCREQTGCEILQSWSNRARCGALRIAEGGADDPGAYETVQCLMNTAQQAPSTSGCTKGVGGAIFIAAGVSAHVHECEFTASNPLPLVPNTTTFTSSTGEILFYADEAGRHVYAESRFRLSETRFDGGGNSFAPSTAIMGCPNTCASGGTCLADEDGFTPSVRCACLGAYEGDDGYAEGGCELRRVRSVRAQTARKYEDGEHDADGYVDFSWSWEGDTVDYFIVSRTTSREASGTRSTAGCIAANEAAFVVADCVTIQDPDARSLRMGLRVGEGSFFRVAAVVDGTSTQESDAMSLASIVCQPGSQRVRTDEDGAYECEMCGRATFVESLEVGCVACPNELQTTVGVATSADDCVSPSGFFMYRREGDAEVISCEEGLNCTETGMTLETLELLPGYWRASLTSTTIHACPNPAYCTGGNGVGASKNKRALSIWSEPLYCAPGHTGPFCEVCAEGFSKRPDTMCSACTEAQIQVDRGIAFGLLALVCILWPLIIAVSFYSALKTEAQRQKPADGCCAGPRNKVRSLRDKWHGLKQYVRGPVSVLVGFIQVITGFQRVFGPTYEWWGHWDVMTASFSWLNVDTSKIPSVTGCAIGDSHRSRLLLATITPLALVAVVLLCYVAARCLVARNAARRVQLRWSALWIVSMLLFLVYPSVNITLFQTFVCDSFDDGSRYLRFDSSTSCDNIDDLVLYARIMTVLYVLGPIVLFTAIVSKSGDPAAGGVAFLHELYVIGEDMRAGRLDWKTRFRRHYEVIELLRKLLQTSVVLVVADGSVGQIAFAILVTFLFSSLHAHARPYAKRLDNLLASLAHTELFLILFMLLVSPVVDDIAALEGGMVGMLAVFPLVAFVVISIRIWPNSCGFCARCPLQGTKRHVRIDGSLPGRSRSSSSNTSNSSTEDGAVVADDAGAAASSTARSYVAEEQRSYVAEEQRSYVVEEQLDQLLDADGKLDPEGEGLPTEDAQATAAPSSSSRSVSIANI